MFRQDILLSGNIQVQGEVSNCKDHSTGLYFTLKDDKAVINCVMFRSAAAGLAFLLRPGDKVTVTGSIDVYAKNGSYQLYAKRIEKAGAGELYERYLKLKEKLEDMGMFDPMYKKQIPAFAKRIGIVTSETGAVIQDIRNVSRRRYSGVELVLYPSLVQGESAAPSIVKGIRTLDRLGLDVIIVGRGGGSIEDLWAFNEEIVARAIFDADTPIISAVGHETDWTIADFVSDLRAPTPSAAAELAVPDVKEILAGLQEKEIYFKNILMNQIAYERRVLREYDTRIRAQSPANILQVRKEQLAACRQKLDHGMSRSVEQARHKTALLTEKLEGSSPLKKLTQGYSYAADADGKGVRSIKQVKTKDKLTIYVTDGLIRTTVDQTEHSEDLYGK